MLGCTEWRAVKLFPFAAACCGTDILFQVPAASGTWRSLHRLLAQLLWYCDATPQRQCCSIFLCSALAVVSLLCCPVMANPCHACHACHSPQGSATSAHLAILPPLRPPPLTCAACLPCSGHHRAALVDRELGRPPAGSAPESISFWAANLVSAFRLAPSSHKLQLLRTTSTSERLGRVKGPLSALSSHVGGTGGACRTM